MEGEDFIEVPRFSNSGYVSEKDNARVSGGGADSLPLKSEAKSDFNGETSRIIPVVTCESGFEALETESVPENTSPIDEINQEARGTIDDSSNEYMKAHMTTDIEKDAVHKISIEPVDFEMTESVTVVRAVTSISSVNTENGSLAVESKTSSSILKKNGTIISSQEIDNGSKSGVKRPRITVDEHEPSVHVMYSSLTRESKRKLEELLQQWSRWHAQNCSMSNDSHTVIESGEKTYFPALHVGVDKSSQVTFWVDNQTKIQSNEFIPLDDTSVPIYDRGYSLALTSGDGSGSLDGGVEKLDTSRCFNCSSYGHALKDCPKPRDNAAVNNARKQHKSKRNQNANSRNSARYYQSSPGGKYDGLIPGVLDPETRQLLGIGELDPPPWLTRMREIGYPPGYLDTDEEEEPSGITIFGDDPNKEKGGEGKILGAGPSKLTRKKSVQFPGINAPIPEKADEGLWAATSSSSGTTLSRDHLHLHHRYSNNYSSENLSSRVNYHEQQQPIWSTDLDDERPPGSKPWTSPSLSYHYRWYDRDYDHEPCHNSFSRYGDYDSPRTSSLRSPWSPTYGRALSDRGWRSPLAQDEYPNYGHYGS